MKAIRVTTRDTNKVLYINIIYIDKYVNDFASGSGSIITMVNGEKIYVLESNNTISNQILAPINVEL